MFCLLFTPFFMVCVFWFLCLDLSPLLRLDSLNISEVANTYFWFFTLFMDISHVQRYNSPALVLNGS